MSFLQKPFVRAILWLLTLSVAVMIFQFSAQDGATSANTSDQITDVIAPVL